MSKKYKNKSLSEQVSENLNSQLNNPDTSSEDEETPKVTHFNEDDYNFDNDESTNSLSEIRKRNIKLLSEQSTKYSGVISSRKNYDISDEDGDGDGDVDDDERNNLVSVVEDHQDQAEWEKGDSEDEFSDESDTNPVSDESFSSNDEEETPEGKLFAAKNNKLEAEKGICVQNQLSIWEKLLEIRIHSQKILNKANSLPNPDDFNKLYSHKEFKEPAEDVKKNAEILLEKLIETQVTLASQFSEIKKIGLAARKRSNSRSNEGSESLSKKFAPVIEDNFEKFRPYRNTVLLKWEDRTKLANPSTGSKRKQLTDEFDIVKKVDNILMKRDEHIAKSQKLKGTYKLFSQNKGENTDDTADGKEVSSPHIYDDTDFYHSQLRELIEFKSNESSNAYDVTKQFAELQKLRQKMKKKVDTRASKGRKIRYVVHNKLVNFMAPNDACDWTDESKNELYRSLFVT